jgi:hypothetical protein
VGIMATATELGRDNHSHRLVMLGGEPQSIEKIDTYDPAMILTRISEVTADPSAVTGKKPNKSAE